MRIVVALDSFKGSISASRACQSVAEGLGDTGDHRVILRPMADGGEGTLDAFAAAHPDAALMPARVTGPHGRPVEGRWLLLPDGTGVVELASLSGIELLGHTLLPWDASTSGFGEAVVAALEHGVRRLLLGVGSSSSTDGGSGLLAALGARVVDAAGQPVVPGARGLSAVASVDLAGLRSLPPEGVGVLSDVTNPLLGHRGAAAVFGPQKGFAPDDIPLVEHALANWASYFTVQPDLPGAGAAGGAGFGLLVWGAEVVPGARAVAELSALAEAIASADLVITGEGRYDGQSAEGKVPSYVLQAARDAGAPVALIAGEIAADADVTPFCASVSLSLLAGGARKAIENPARWLRAAAVTALHG